MFNILHEKSGPWTAALKTLGLIWHWVDVHRSHNFLPHFVPVDDVSNPAKNKRRAFEMSAASISS